MFIDIKQYDLLPKKYYPIEKVDTDICSISFQINCEFMFYRAQ
ncbi:hypothetical protein HMPREF0454_04082 [Hafnia alvei ATCC 51873]|uniref:Uncharacterized protein n=1 Tax=Hafnia alvei ATCC 51873 TaxID=1002364 RepID=G9YBQ3_HAFAL|nr:hypothetical protein HMPREF0454_04082 [Hafnia alvei ATCC 51873]